MQSERIHFVALSAALASRGDDPHEIFGDLVFRAHKLRGAAEIFEATSLPRRPTRSSKPRLPHRARMPTTRTPPFGRRSATS